MKRFRIVTSIAVVSMLMLAVAPAVFAVELQNPLGSVNDPRIIIGNIIRAVLGIIGSIALAIFILGGFYWVTSAGSEEKVTKGKNMIMWATFGLAVIFFAYAIVTFVVGAITGVGGDGGSEIPSGGGQQIPGGGGNPI